MTEATRVHPKYLHRSLTVMSTVTLAGMSCGPSLEPKSNKSASPASEPRAASAEAEVAAQESSESQPTGKSTEVLLARVTVLTGTTPHTIARPEPTATGDNAQTPITLGTTRPRLADADELASHYQRVFGVTEETTFPGAARASLGTFDLDSRSELEKNANWAEGLTQEYVATLRSFLARACTDLVASEWNPDVEGDALASNHLVFTNQIDARPSTEQISAFMSLMFGYSLPAGHVHPGAAEYAAAFDAIVNQWNQNNPLAGDFSRRSFLRRNYTLLCVAIGTDLRLFVH